MFLFDSAPRVFRATEYDEPSRYDAAAVKRGDQPPPRRLRFEATAGIAMPAANLNHVFVSESFVDAVRTLSLADVVFIPCADVLNQPQTFLRIVEKTA